MNKAVVFVGVLALAGCSDEKMAARNAYLEDMINKNATANCALMKRDADLLALVERRLISPVDIDGFANSERFFNLHTGDHQEYRTVDGLSERAEIQQLHDRVVELNSIRPEIIKVEEETSRKAAECSGIVEPTGLD